jgi:hypothetical protein
LKRTIDTTRKIGASDAAQKFRKKSEPKRASRTDRKLVKIAGRAAQ